MFGLVTKCSVIIQRNILGDFLYCSSPSSLSTVHDNLSPHRVLTPCYYSSTFAPPLSLTSASLSTKCCVTPSSSPMAKFEFSAIYQTVASLITTPPGHGRIWTSVSGTCPLRAPAGTAASGWTGNVWPVR